MNCELLIAYNTHLSQVENSPFPFLILFDGKGEDAFKSQGQY